jgi:hypothetical protein
MSWPKRALLVSIAVAALSLWLPWVWHRSAALVLSGLDLPEFAGFMGEVRRGEVRFEPLAFLWPVVALALVCAVSVTSRSLSVYARLLGLAFALWLLALVFPPLERRNQLIVFGVLTVVAHVAASVRRWPPALGSALLILTALTAALAPLAQLLLLLPALSRLYAEPVTPGAGVYLCGASLLLTVAASMLMALRSHAPRFRPRRGRPLGSPQHPVR